MNEETSPEPTPDWYATHVVADTERFAAIVDRHGLDTAVPSCPGWELSDLTQHLGRVQRWASFCAAEGRAPTDDEAAPMAALPRDTAGDWMRVGAAELAGVLRTIDPAAPTWHPFPVERIGAVWPRRLAHETAMHRLDAELAAGSPTPIDALLASDGIDEYFELAVPRLLKRDGVVAPTQSLHVHCTDVAGEWLVWTENGEYRMKRAHEKGDAALRGPAEAILLRLWGRPSRRSDELSPVGDETALVSWLALTGM